MSDNNLNNSRERNSIPVLCGSGMACDKKARIMNTTHPVEYMPVNNSASTYDIRTLDFGNGNIPQWIMAKIANRHKMFPYTERYKRVENKSQSRQNGNRAELDAELDME